MDFSHSCYLEISGGVLCYGHNVMLVFGIIFCLELVVHDCLT